jgi:hypothetical protein
MLQLYTYNLAPKLLMQTVLPRDVTYMYSCRRSARFVPRAALAPAVLLPLRHSSALIPALLLWLKCLPLAFFSSPQDTTQSESRWSWLLCPGGGQGIQDVLRCQHAGILLQRL